MEGYEIIQVGNRFTLLFWSWETLEDVGDYPDYLECLKAVKDHWKNRGKSMGVAPLLRKRLEGTT